MADRVLTHVNAGAGVGYKGVEAAVVLGAGVSALLQGCRCGVAGVTVGGHEGAKETNGGQGRDVTGHVWRGMHMGED